MLGLLILTRRLQSRLRVTPLQTSSGELSVWTSGLLFLDRPTKTYQSRLSVLSRQSLSVIVWFFTGGRQKEKIWMRSHHHRSQTDLKPTHGHQKIKPTNSYSAKVPFPLFSPVQESAFFCVICGYFNSPPPPPEGTHHHQTPASPRTKARSLKVCPSAPESPTPDAAVACWSGLPCQTPCHR